MLDETTPDTTLAVTEINTEATQASEASAAPAKAPAKKAAAKAKPAGSAATDAPKAPAKKAAAKKAPAKKAPAKKTAAAEAPVDAQPEAPTDAAPAKKAAAKKAPAKKAAAKKAPAAKAKPATDAPKTAAAKKAAAVPADAEALPLDLPVDNTDNTDAAPAEKPATRSRRAPASAAVLFQAPDATTAAPRTRNRKPAAAATDEVTEATDATVSTDAVEVVEGAEAAERPARNRQGRGNGQGNRGGGQKKAAAKPAPSDAEAKDADADEDDTVELSEDGTENDENEDGTETGPGSAARRRRRRGGRRRRKPGDSSDSGEREGDAEGDDESGDAAASDDTDGEQSENGEGGTTRRRRVRVRDGEGRQGGGQNDDPNTVTRVRPSRTGEDQITSISGSTRLEAKKQRRRDGREAGRRRAPIVSEAEFLARREAVDRVMAIRQRDDLTQIAVLEDKVLVEHYVARESQTSLIGNVYVGRVQNVLPSMEAAFIDIGKGRNAVLYAGEVNWSAMGHREGQPRKIESVLSSGQAVLVQVTKDPVGHKGARLTSQVSLAGRFLVYVPDGTTSGISRKLPDTERSRLKTLLKEIVPDTAGVIVRTAAEGASEDELTRDVEVLKARWEEIEKQSKIGNGPKLLYGEPDLTLKVVRDLFTEDFAKLVIQGTDAWNTVQQYVDHVAPDLSERLEQYDVTDGDLFADLRVSEQIAKGLDRKVWLPSGGSLVIDRTEAMTVVDVNTGKFTGSGGNLEETVTKNNLEAAEEVVRQLRLRDIGGIIVVDFIDMVLESNRDLVLRRLVECLGRDRTRHQVAEVTSLGLVQMTRKRIGTGLLEAFTETCETCSGSGHITHDLPVEPKHTDDGGERRTGNRRNRGRGGNESGEGNRQGNQAGDQAESKVPSPKELADSHPAPAVSEYPDEVPAHVLKARAEAAEKVAEAERKSAERESARESGSADDVAEAPAENTDGRAAGDEQRSSGGNRNRNRNRGRGQGGQGGRSAEPASEDNADAQAEVAEVEAPVEAPVVEAPVVEAPAVAAPVVEAPVAPAAPVDTAPKVITRTRRTASRPAGAGISLEPVAIVVAETPVVASEPVVAPEPPKVITRTRRAATRPAGAGTSAPATEPAPEAAVEAPAETPAEEAHMEHVPIKNKGARKR